MSTDSGTGAGEMLEELAAIAASARALVEWHASTGGAGLLCERDVEEVLAALSPPAAGRSGAGSRRAAAHPPPDFVKPPSFVTGAQVATGAQAPSPSPLGHASIPTASLGGPGEQPRPEAAAAPLLADKPAPSIATAVSGSETPEERRIKLATIADEVRSCTRCGLHAQRKQTVFARGNPFSELCFLGEGPGADEDIQGLPFVGKAGQLLDKMIAAMGYGRDDVYICNIVKCRPPENRKPEPNEMAACSPYLTAQLALAKPRVIVALGATAVQGLTGVGEGITRMRGKWKLYKGTTPIMPTFHPAYLLRQPSAKRDVWNDLKEVLRFLGKTPP